MRLFRWLSATPVPPSFDLRRLGWELVAPEAVQVDTRHSPALVHAELLDEPGWSGLDEWSFAPMRSLILLIGIDDLDARARLLKLGFGDVTGSEINLREIEARALRIAAQAALMPRMRQFGEQRLGLHPREFALLWRLSDTPGQAVSKRVLIRDVWRMAHVPETNSLAVHVYRLRAKLAAAGLDGMVQTTLDGGYRFEPVAMIRPASPFNYADERHDEDAPLALSVIQGLTREPQA